jgi:hypothetical protein
VAITEAGPLILTSQLPQNGHGPAHR